MRWTDVMTSGGVYVILAVLCSNVLSAPVLPQASVNDGAPSSPQIENQEQELENLIQFAQHQASQPNTQVQKTHTLTIEEHDGTKMEDHVMEEKVVDPSDGTVVSDVKQEVKEVKSGDVVQPESVVETEVNIPSAGIDESFVQKWSSRHPRQDPQQRSRHTVLSHLDATQAHLWVESIPVTNY